MPVLHAVLGTGSEHEIQLDGVMEVQGPPDAVSSQEPGFPVPNSLNLDFFDLLPSLPLPQLPGLSSSKISDLCDPGGVLETSHEDIRVLGTLLSRTDISYL